MSATKTKQVYKGDSNTVWKLFVKEGRQVWRPVHVEESGDADQLQSFVDKFWTTKPACVRDHSYENESPLFESTEDSIKAALKFYSSVQTEDGHWAGDYGGPLFLLPGFIIVAYICSVLTSFADSYRKEMARYIKNAQNEDGGWGLHIEGDSIMFGSCLNYVALRILGVDKDEPLMANARRWMHENGTALGSPQWGKLYLCALNVMEWSGMDPVPPELWLLPSWFPLVQPGKWWCHCRVVYLPMAYVFGRKKRAPVDPLILSLRQELYTVPYDRIEWGKYRQFVCPYDVYKPLHFAYKILAFFTVLYERIVHLPPFSWLRKLALDKCIDHIKHEDTTTKHICIGPVNKVLNMLSVYLAEGHSKHFEKHVDRCYDYLWESDLGMLFQGYNGSQLWDTAFAVQAIAGTGLGDEIKGSVFKAHDYIRYSQVREDVDNLHKYYRHISNGGWPFSTLDHGWPISDCTAEGLKACLLLQKIGSVPENVQLPAQRAYDAVNVIMSMWNEGSGGWATYELSRTYPIIEALNPAVLYGDIMIDYPHVECTSACVQALCSFRAMYPGHRRAEIDRAVNRGVGFIRSIQKPEGGWYGGWAVCFCYGTWFGVWAQIAAGVDKNHPSILRALEFLVSKQQADGGWGESYLSCVKHQYVQSHRSQVVNTSWALLALMAADYQDKSVIERGIQLLRRRQMDDGDFPQENISGVFNMNCMISYTNYRNIFPIWALGYFYAKYAKKQLPFPEKM